MGLRKIRAAGAAIANSKIAPLAQHLSDRPPAPNSSQRPRAFGPEQGKLACSACAFFPEFVVYAPAWHRQAHEPYDGSVILFFLRFVPRKYTFFGIPPHWVFVRPRRQIWRFDATWHLTLAHFRCEPREGNLVSGYVPLPLFSLRVTNASKRHSRPHPHLPHTHTPNHQQNNGRYLRYERHRPRRCQARQGHRR